MYAPLHRASVQTMCNARLRILLPPTNAAVALLTVTRRPNEHSRNTLPKVQYTFLWNRRSAFSPDAPRRTRQEKMFDAMLYGPCLVELSGASQSYELPVWCNLPLEGENSAICFGDTGAGA